MGVSDSAPLHTVCVAVVIPFFQRTQGVLQAAVESATEQRLQSDVRVRLLVIDDESPISAALELTDLVLPSNYELTVITQPNRGPAGARNRGLASLDDTVDFVAFLDSDDRWTDDHLANALEALGYGYDFYFADFYQLDQQVSAFHRAGRLHPTDHPTLGSTEYLHEYAGDMSAQIVTGNVIGTSTVVYRRSAAPSLLFREEFVTAGEDYLFWLDFTRRSSRIAFSSRCECRYGRGVNVYSGVVWGTEESLARNRYESAYKRIVLAEVALTAGQRNTVLSAISELRDDYARQLVHRLAHRKAIPFWTVVAQFAADPALLLHIPRTVWQLMRRGFKH